MGMGTVFLVLIFISLIISSFKKVNEIEANVKAKKAGAEAPAAAPAPVQTAAPAAAPARTAAPEAGNAANDGELVAVITAAIAAATGVPADSVNIRSITRKKSSIKSGGI